MAIVSIFHRISGVILFIFLPILIYWLHLGLVSDDSFLHLTVLLKTPVCKLIVWMVMSALFFHCIAGIRHIVMDFGYFESVKAGFVTACLVIILECAAMITF